MIDRERGNDIGGFQRESAKLPTPGDFLSFLSFLSVLSFPYFLSVYSALQ